MEIGVIKEIARIIKKEPLSVLIILSLIFVPYFITRWIKLFPQSWYFVISIIFVIFWIYAFFRLREEIKIWQRKTLLINYLKKDRRHTFHHLSKEWIAKDEFTPKNIEKLILEFPDELKTVRMKKGLGVGLL
jgi:hypothetical protein